MIDDRADTGSADDGFAEDSARQLVEAIQLAVDNADWEQVLDLAAHSETMTGIGSGEQLAIIERKLTALLSLTEWEEAEELIREGAVLGVLARRRIQSVLNSLLAGNDYWKDRLGKIVRAANDRSAAESEAAVGASTPAQSDAAPVVEKDGPAAVVEDGEAAQNADSQANIEAQVRSALSEFDEIPSDVTDAGSMQFEDALIEPGAAQPVAEHAPAVEQHVAAARESGASHDSDQVQTPSAVDAVPTRVPAVQETAEEGRSDGVAGERREQSVGDGRSMDRPIVGDPSRASEGGVPPSAAEDREFDLDSDESLYPAEDEVPRPPERPDIVASAHARVFPEYAEAEGHIDLPLLGEGGLADAEQVHRFVVTNPGEAGLSILQRFAESEAIRLSETDLEELFDQGLTFIGMEQLELAVTTLLPVAVVPGPYRVSATEALASTLFQLGRLVEARAYLLGALPREPRDPEYAGLFYWLGQVAEEMGNVGGARTYYMHALELMPDLVEARRRAAVLLDHA